MKFRIVTLILLATFLSACNLTLAEDVTPPPGYIPPTPAPTLVLVPPQTPNVANGEAIYFEKCAACHGDTGLGDGPQGIQLGVTVPAFALPEIARPASPAGWYTIVTRGKIERFMPPFASLNDQERWDVVAYIMTLHTSEEEIQKGKDIFEANCPDCSTNYYKDQNKMSSLSTVALARIARLGNEEIPAFGENLSDEDMWAVAEYLRSLTYNSTPPQPTPIPATKTPVPADAGTPSTEGTPVGTEQAQITEEAAPVVEGSGNVSGSIENRTGADLPEDLSVTLRGYEHDFANPNAGTQEILTLEGLVASDGSFVFENVEIPENRIFLAEVSYSGIELSSEFVIVEAGQTSVELPPLVLYKVTDDTSALIVDELNIFLSAENDSVYDILALYTFRNASESIVAVSVGTQEEIPFLKFPVGAQGQGYEAVQDSARFTSTADGFAMTPNEQPYGILSYSSIAEDKEVTISQPLALAVTNVRIFVPDGMKVESDQVEELGPQDIQGLAYQSYSAGGLNAGDMLTFTVSGSPKDTAAGTDTSTSNNTLLIGAGGLGMALILAGAWMYLRERNRIKEEDEDEDESDEADEFESSEDVMDAIIALDDLYRAKKISDDVYQKRRAELKEALKEML
ncbi:MAG TPA: c-type cytochrome [Anaerolineales bacterium]|nr:c-type cytochrome [Anaerolineales bacterium]